MTISLNYIFLQWRLPGLVEVQCQEGCFSSLLNAALLVKVIKAKLWENSKHVARQLPGIGQYKKYQLYFLHWNWHELFKVQTTPARQTPQMHLAALFMEYCFWSKFIWTNIHRSKTLPARITVDICLDINYVRYCNCNVRRISSLELTCIIPDPNSPRKTNEHPLLRLR